MFHHVDAWSGFMMATALLIIASECVYALSRRARKAARPVTYIRPGQSRLRRLSQR